MSDYALWWSPDSAGLAFLRFDETNVEEFSYPVYNPASDPNKVVPIQTRSSLSGIREDETSQTWVPQSHRQRPYLCYLAAQEPEEEGHTLEMVERGDIAPVPATHVVTLSWEEQRLAKDSIIQEVAWVHNATLIIKETDRSGNDRSVILFDLSHRPDRMGMIVRSLGKNGELSDSGCIDMVRRDLGMTKVKQCRPFHSHNISIVFRNRWSAPTLPILISCPMKKATTTLRCSALLTRVFPSGLLLALGKSQAAC